LKKLKMKILPISCIQRLIPALLCIMTIISTATAAEKLLSPSAKDKCPVCGMFVKKYPDWLTAVRLESGKLIFFDGAKDMFKFLHEPSKYARVKTEIVSEILVREYYSLEWLDARKVYYVIGSDIYGPMGRELIPFKNEADAREFANDHRGKKILKYSEITPAVIKNFD
jgi:copper chaperone NosL